jgi:dethiobiotin synthetase
VTLLVVTGTGTGVGKTVVTAAVAAVAAARGGKVAVVKPVQTGLPGGAPGDLDEVRRLAAFTDLHELARYPAALSPEAAARAAGGPALDLREAAGYIRDLGQTRSLVLVEGAGGLLVRYDQAGTTIAGLAGLLSAPVLVVTGAGLGTLNHTALTLEALAARRLTVAGVVIGSWPARPGPAELSNVADLETVTGGPIAGALPAGCGQASPAGFLAAARAGLAPAFGGCFDPAEFGQAAAQITERASGGPSRDR